MRLRSLSAALIVSSLVAAVLTTGALSPAAAVEDPDERHFGMVGLVSGQTARLNVVNVTSPDAMQHGPCRAVLSFVDSRGHLLHDFEGHPVLVEDPDLRPGEATFLDFLVEDPNERRRVETRAVVTADRACSQALVASVEIFDTATGKTLIYFGTDPNLRR